VNQRGAYGKQIDRCYEFVGEVLGVKKGSKKDILKNSLTHRNNTPPLIKRYKERKQCPILVKKREKKIAQ